MWKSGTWQLASTVHCSPRAVIDACHIFISLNEESELCDSTPESRTDKNEMIIRNNLCASHVGHGYMMPPVKSAHVLIILPYTALPCIVGILNQGTSGMGEYVFFVLSRQIESVHDCQFIFFFYIFVLVPGRSIIFFIFILDMWNMWMGLLNIAKKCSIRIRFDIGLFYLCSTLFESNSILVSILLFEHF